MTAECVFCKDASFNDGVAAEWWGLVVRMALAWTGVGSAAGALCDAPSLALSKAISFLGVERSAGAFTRITVVSMSAEMLCALPVVTGWRLCFLDVLSVRVLPTPIGLCLFYGTIVRSCAWPSFVFLCRMITLLSRRRGLEQWLAPLYHNRAWRTPNPSLCSLSSLSLLP